MSVKINLFLLCSALVVASLDAFALRRPEESITPAGYSCEEYLVGLTQGNVQKVRLCAAVPATPPRYNTPSNLYDVLGLSPSVRNLPFDADAYLPLPPNEEQLQSLDWQQPRSAMKPNNDDSSVFKRFTQMPTLPYPLRLSSQQMQNRESNMIEPNEGTTNDIGWRELASQTDAAFERRLNKISDDVSTIKDSLTDLTAFVKNYVNTLDEKQLSAVESKQNKEEHENENENNDADEVDEEQPESLVQKSMSQPETYDLSKQLMYAFMQGLLLPDLPSNHELKSSKEEEQEESMSAESLEVASETSTPKGDTNENENTDAQTNDNGMAKIIIHTRIRWNPFQFSEDSEENSEEDNRKNMLSFSWRFNKDSDEKSDENDFTSTTVVSSDENTSEEDTTPTYTEFTSDETTSREDLPQVERSSEEQSSTETDKYNEKSETDYYDEELHDFLRSHFILRTREGPVEETTTTEIEAMSSKESNENVSEERSDSKENDSEEGKTEESEGSEHSYSESYGLQEFLRRYDDWRSRYFEYRASEMPTYYNVKEESKEQSSEDNDQTEGSPEQVSNEENENAYHVKYNNEWSNEEKSEDNSPTDDSNEKLNVDCDISQYTNGREFSPLTNTLVKRLMCSSENTKETSENTSGSASKEKEEEVGESLEVSTETNWSYEEEMY